MDRSKLLHALTRFVNSRPGLDFGNYGDVQAYRAESRSITRDRDHALELLAAIGWRESITAADIVAAAESAFSGRLKISERADGAIAIDYCAGQYYPTEYRRAVCSVLSSVLWSYFRDDCNAATGDDIRRMARRELSRSVSTRWFR